MTTPDQNDARRNEEALLLAREILGEEQLAALCETEVAARESDAPPVTYWSGPIISIGTMRHEHLAGNTNNTGLISMIAASVRDSRISSLIHAVVRHSGAGDRIVCAFEDGRQVPLDDARKIALKGYAASVGKVLQGS